MEGIEFYIYEDKLWIMLQDGTSKEVEESDTELVQTLFERIKEQYPEIDFRIVFYNANQKIKKGSKTTYAMWCDKHGIKWANKTIPPEWVEEIFDDLAKSKG